MVGAVDSFKADVFAGNFEHIGKEESWLVNVSSASRNRQEIVPVRVTGPAPGLSDSFALKVRIEQGQGGATATLGKAGLSGPQPATPEFTEIPLELGQRIWCLDGPDFFELCS